MGYLTAGINHKTAPISLREQVAFSPDQLLEAMVNAKQTIGIEEVAILSTCNRTELYCSFTEDNHDYPLKVIDWLSTYHCVDHKLLSEHTYVYQNKDSVRHLMRVACGLDSLVLGEPQILGQLKTAYSLSQEAGTAGASLNRLFQHSFTTAKQIRTDTAINQQPVSVAYAATRLARQIFSDLSKSTALLIGAGETIELVARHLRQQGLTRIIVANRTMERARLLTEEFGGQALLLSDLSQVLHMADIVIASTASPVPVLGKGAVERALKARKHNPMFMVDIAIPRDIEPEVAQLADVFLYTVDDLQDVIEDNIQQRRKAAEQAESMIESDAFEFMNRLRALEAVNVLRNYRQHTESMRDIELAKALLQLEKGGNPAQVLNQFARSLTNKLMHSPSVQLKKAASRGELDRLDWAEELLGIIPSGSQQAMEDA